MKHPHGAALTIPTVPLWVCESGRRWGDAAKRFVGPFQHHPTPDSTDRAESGERMFHVQSLDAAGIRAQLSAHRDLVILWEVATENAPAIALHIAQIGVARPDVLQLAAIDDLSRLQSRRLALRMMELGAAAVLHDPLDLAVYAKLVHRRFARTRRLVKK
ncbi:hypothetical protein [Stieleria mannarensis]|uniref:hypothetical protein n=1 Tax=Stieleria mannarensis TaxID=2755585 RepID=UPI0016033933|nr:hypothetical protein [Rhodopirellula sp. JC639]